ncbi:MAG: DUF5606 domain-containing protein [Flavobacteriaceae bacterium]|jgi:hypothetical protein|nr:DUF5606 domain-containing protein [Flavobacteriaceae bacterium]
MDLTKIITITGKPGLFELLSQTKNGFIVKDLVNQKKLSIPANSQVSLLQNISIYTHESETSLISVLVAISKKYNYKEIEFDKKDSQTLRTLMTEVQPDYAEDRVYDSDLRKLFTWYNILVKNTIITEESIKAYTDNLSKTTEEPQEPQTEEVESEEIEVKKEEKTKKKKKSEK